MGYTLICEDVSNGLLKIDDKSVQTCITSPPYFNMRDYGFDSQIGLEKTPEHYVEKLVNVFNGVRKVLRDDGTLWINIGDSYSKKSQGKIKEKDIIGIPWMLAFALRDSGWYLRSDIIWAKPNPLPSGSNDKPISSHEYIFLFSKNKNYFYDAESSKEISIEKNKEGLPITRMKRDVWSVPVASSKIPHFAVFPKKLIHPCVVSSISTHGCCDNCFAPYKRILEKNRYSTRPGINNKKDRSGFANRDNGRHITETKTKGWEKTCQCNSNSLEKCKVLDIFCGSGTTGVVALENNGSFIGIDGNEEYIKIAKNNLDIASNVLFRD